MIHKFSINDHNIVLDVESGLVHIFDKIAYEVLDYIDEKSIENIAEKLNEKYSVEEINVAYNEIKELTSDGLLFSKKEEIKDANEANIIKALCLHAAHDCNLRCKYCFASTGDYGGGRNLMSLEVGKKAISLLLQNSGNRKNLEVDFFGGEPLLNFETVKQIVTFARDEEKKYGKNIRFTITTNGVLLNDEIEKYINENMVNVVLSIDGRPEVNDKVRCRVDNSGSYKTILPKIKKMVESRNHENYYVRGTFTRYNLDFSKDVCHLADMGFKQISVEPVVASLDKDYALREEDLDIICNEYENLANEYIKRHKQGNGFNFFHFMMSLEDGPCAYKRSKGCGAGFEYLAVTPDGNIYPCHQFAENDEFLLGSVLEGSLKDDIRMDFKKSNINTKQECQKCWAKYYCSGGCSANAWQFNGDINIPYELGCKLQRKRIECALMIKAALV